MKNKTTINRVYKDKGFIQLDNALLQNRNLSFAAKGLLGMVLSLPTDWVIYMEWIHTQFPEGENKVRTIVNELRAMGYARYSQVRDERGRICGACWDFSEEPIYEPAIIEKSPKRGNPVLDNQALQTHSKQTQNILNSDSGKRAKTKKGEGVWEQPRWGNTETGKVMFLDRKKSEKVKPELDWTPITGKVDTETGEIIDCSGIQVVNTIPPSSTISDNAGIDNDWVEAIYNELGAQYGDSVKGSGNDGGVQVSSPLSLSEINSVPVGNIDSPLPRTQHHFSVQEREVSKENKQGIAEAA